MLRLALIAFVALASPALAQNLAATLGDAMSGTRTPALGAVVIRDGHVAEMAVRGLRRNDAPESVRPDDVWQIGSNGKPMTVALIAKLAERGTLKWTAKLSELLPNVAMLPEYRRLTLIDLLSHRGGFARDTTDAAFFRSFATDVRPLPQQRLTYIAKVLNEPPEVPPGTRFHYSNSGFLIAAAIAEHATGTPYEELMQHEIFQPLGMTSAGFGPVPPGSLSGHRNGKPSAQANPAVFAPAGNIHMTLADWAKFCLDQMTSGRGKLLKSTSYELIQAPVAASTSALGWGVQNTLLGHAGPVLTHAGSDGSWYALVVLFPQRRSGILVTTNAADDMGGDKAAKAVVQALLPTLAPGE